MSSATAEIPGYLPGTWRIDPARSELRVTVTHLGLSTVRGRIGSVEGEIVVGEDPAECRVAAIIDLRTIDTRSKGRDEAIRSDRLLRVAEFPTAAYRSTDVRPDPAATAPGAFVLGGDLTFMGTTVRVPLRLCFDGVVTDTAGRARPCFTARGVFARRDFGLRYRVQPAFLDGAIGRVVTVEACIEGTPGPS
jgi:polyisoprenoid-binding protein YceI